MEWLKWLAWGTLDWRVSTSSIMNALFLAYQFWTLWKTKRSEGLSLVMLWGFLYMQISFAQYGWQTKQVAVLWGMAASAGFTLMSILYALYLRKQEKGKEGGKDV